MANLIVSAFQSFVKKTVKSVGLDSIRVAVWMAIGGGALTVGNLLFAGLLSATNFGKLTFFEALLSLGVGIGPLGFDSLAVRGELSSDNRSLLLGSLGAVAASSVLCFGAGLFYDLDLQILGLGVFGCTGGAIGRVCAAFEQGEVRLDRAQAIDQLPSLVFVLLAVVSLIFGLGSFLIAVMAISVGYLASGVLGLTLFRLGYRGAPEDTGKGRGEIHVLRGKALWVRALTLLAISGSGLLLTQVERFIIPRTLGLAELGTFGVAWTVVGSPYKLLSGGIGYALLPKLRSSKGEEQSRRFVRRELKLALVLGGSVALPLLIAGPYIVTLLYGEKYPVSSSLVIAIVVLGFSRLFYGLANAIIIGRGSGEQLHKFNVASWASIVFTIFFAIWCSRWGLVGIILAVALGWVLRSICAIFISSIWR